VPEAPTPSDEKEAGLEIRWVFHAPGNELWREWTEPERFADWYGADAEVPLESVSMDVRPGGRWSLTMLVGGREIDWDGEYLEVEEPQRLVLTVRDDPTQDLYELCTVELTETGDERTEMHFQQTGQMPAEAYKRARQGWATFFREVDGRLAGA